jgi:predicted nucleic acid-binding protein
MNYTTGKYFLDTNFLIYLFSGDEQKKQQICREVLQAGAKEAVFVLSTQVIKEFVSVMIGKFKVQPSLVKELVDDLCQFEVIQITPLLIQKAVDIHTLHRFSFWDSLILVAAQSAKANILLSEDLQHSQKLGNLTIWNPFQIEG